MNDNLHADDRKEERRGRQRHKEQRLQRPEGHRFPESLLDCDNAIMGPTRTSARIGSRIAAGSPIVLITVGSPANCSPPQTAADDDGPVAGVEVRGLERSAQQCWRSQHHPEGAWPDPRLVDPLRLVILARVSSGRLL